MTNTLKQLILQTLTDMKANDIVELDVSALTTITDILIICSSRSSRHGVATANKLIEMSKKAKHPPLSCEGKEDAEWILLDLGDIVVHIMQVDTRQFYQLEALWSRS